MDLGDSRVRHAAEELKIETPIMDVRVVGERLEMHLLGGTVVYWPSREVEATAVETGGLSAAEKWEVANLYGQPQMQSRNALRPVARALEIEGWEAMKKPALVKAINRWKREYTASVD